MTHRYCWSRSIPLILAAVVLLLPGCGSDKASNPPVVDPGDQAPPLAPTGVTVEKSTDPKFMLTWDANTEPDLAGYRVYVYDPDPERSNSYILANPASIATDRSMSFAGQDGTSYAFRVTAVDAEGNESAWSELFNYTYTANTRIRQPEAPEPNQPTGREN